MEQIRGAFTRAKNQKRAALVAYITAGYPTIEKTVDILLGLEDGGADIIELGVPFTDPTADGVVIQKANSIPLANGVTISTVIDIVHESKAHGLRAPILLLGYYNSFIHYGGQRLMKVSKNAGVSGFVIPDLPFEESVCFRNLCEQYSLSYVPVISPVSSASRIKALCHIANSFIYVVSRMGVTGSTDKLSPDLPQRVDRIHAWSNNTPVALGFGMSKREHFLFVQEIAEACVIGSKIISVVGDAPAGQEARRAEDYLFSVTRRRLRRDSRGAFVGEVSLRSGYGPRPIRL
ncbi:tryptophan synthase alpha chain-domain-containing protein [Aspergillus avenaceus]|uniref:tryptophan synthase n=1 Tax=Aspergillus avenaceus TaxID=36643 RepID=A0A5N6U3F8_ASPAV|nr:tryptophan synthase alpha chain-domain-containing protein [Aspergillus avenaceus]